MSNTALVNNIYFTCENYNSTTQDIIATQDTSLLYPLIPNGESQNYQLAVAKCRVPLGTVPLTVDNIPLKFYEVLLRNGTYEASAYVKQVNALSGNYYYTLQGSSIERYLYQSNTSILTKTITLINICSFVYQFVVDDYENIYIAGSNTSRDVADTLYIVNSDSPPTLISSTKFDNIKSIYIDRNGIFYLINETETAATVNVYNNQASYDNVQLSLAFTIYKDSNNNNLNNANFVVATENNIIVAHDNYILSYYTASGIPITDYSVQTNGQLVAGNVLASSDILMTSDINQLNDQLIGTKDTAMIDIESGTTLTTVGINSDLAITGSYGYAINTDNHLCYVTWPISSPPASFILINGASSISLKSLAGKKDILAATSTTDDLFYLNLNTPYGAPNTNTLGLIAVNFKPASHSIVSMDWNVSSNKIVVVDTSNGLYITNRSIYPLGMMVTSYLATDVNIYGYSNTDPTQTLNKYLLSTNSYNNQDFSNYIVDNGVIYAIQGEPSQQKVYCYNIKDFTSTGQVYNCSECSGNIYSIAIQNNKIVVVGTYYNVAVYSIIDGSLYANIVAYENDNSVQVIGFQDHQHIAIVHDINTIDIWDYTGTPASVSTYPIGAQIIYSLAFNPNDLNNGIGKLFVSYLSNSQDYLVDAFIFQSNYSISPDRNIAYSVQNNTPFDYIYCNFDNGILFCCQIFSSGTATLFYQSQNYSNTYINLIQNIPTNSRFIYFPQTLTSYYDFIQITTNINPVSIAVSRTNTNTLYAINSADNLLYSGTLKNNAITFTQMQQFPETYSYISTTKNNNTNVNTTLRTFTISNQQQISSVAINNDKVTTIAKNESNSQFLAGLISGNVIKAYNSSLVLQNSYTQQNPSNLFAKPADDINVPNINIYNLQVVIDSINVAFLEAYNKLKALGGTLAEAPYMNIDFSGLLTLNYSADYTQSGNGILFNNPLTNLCYFQNQQDGLDPTFFKIVLKPSSTSITQLTRSIYIFNQLDKILIASTSLFVSGSWYGQNSISQVLTDIDVPIDSSSFAIGNIGQILYYQPTMLRVYQMASGGNSVNRIQMSILYRYRNGSQYNLLLPPGEAFSVKLEFVKKF